MSSRILFGIGVLLAVSTGTGARADAAVACDRQARQVVDRLQREVVGELSADQRSSAVHILLEACQAGAAQAPPSGEQAAQTRKEEAPESGLWSADSADKPGNERLKRRGRY